MKSFKPDTTLNAAQEMLKTALLPQFQTLRHAGYSLKEVGFALADHFKTSGETITVARSGELLNAPDMLILAYRTRNNKRTSLSNQQLMVIKNTFPKAEDQSKATALLITNWVVEVIKPLTFKSIAQGLKTCNLNPTPQQLEQLKTTGCIA